MVSKKSKNPIIVFILSILVFCFLPFVSKAAVLGETHDFYLDSSYDLNNRKSINSQLIFQSARLYFYIDSVLWQLYSQQEKNDAILNLTKLSEEFDKRIYLILVSNYGYEPSPGIDNDPKITILFHQLKRNAGGYFNSGNEYSRYEIPASNEREMIYMNSDYLASPLLKRLLAHEFTHLITFNQKELDNNVEEDVWLNEARAEYAITLCGYDDVYTGSNLQKRVVEFLKNPNDSLVDWTGNSSDYGVLNIFTQYLVDQYGVKILNDSLNSKYTGIESINWALLKNGYSKTFSVIFGDWAVASLLNDCSYGERYCYKNPNLKNFKVIPASNHLFLESGVEASVSYFFKPWSARWDKINEIKGDLIINFSGDESGFFDEKYVLCDKVNKCGIMPLLLDNGQAGKISIDNFDSDYSSMVVISFAKNLNYDNFFEFKLAVKTGVSESAGNNEIQKLLKQIEDLKKQISEIQALLAIKRGFQNTMCKEISNVLYFGLENNGEVLCLQSFLQNQGSDIYPEALITGNFYGKTKKAVIRFQEKYASEILIPIGLSKGIGIVGERTREKINQLLKN